MQDLLELLRNNPYPGRGIVVGNDAVYYWIMGRSENSRNRVFTLTEDGIKTEAYDPSKMKDPSLIIYHPVRTMGDALVVTNGDQTDTILEKGCFRKALMTREYEPCRRAVSVCHFLCHGVFQVCHQRLLLWPANDRRILQEGRWGHLHNMMEAQTRRSG